MSRSSSTQQRSSIPASPACSSPARSSPHPSYQILGALLLSSYPYPDTTVGAPRPQYSIRVVYCPRTHHRARPVSMVCPVPSIGCLTHGAVLTTPTPRWTPVPIIWGPLGRSPHYVRPWTLLPPRSVGLAGGSKQTDSRPTSLTVWEEEVIRLSMDRCPSDPVCLVCCLACLGERYYCVPLLRSARNIAYTPHTIHTHTSEVTTNTSPRPPSTALSMDREYTGFSHRPDASPYDGPGATMMGRPGWSPSIGHPPRRWCPVPGTALRSIPLESRDYGVSVRRRGRHDAA